jgi:membrane-associated protein
MNVVTEVIVALALSPWVFAVLAALLIIDGFFPLVPGETTVVVLATLGAAGHGPAPLAVLFVAIPATMIGDGIAFSLGRRMGTSRWAWMRRPRTARALEWAAAHLQKRPGVILVVAKFIPFARVAITMTAGASGLRVWRYLIFSLVSASLYTAYHVMVATTSGTLFSSNPLLAVGVSIGFGVLSAGVVAGVRRLRKRRLRSVV